MTYAEFRAKMIALGWEEYDTTPRLIHWRFPFDNNKYYNAVVYYDGAPSYLAFRLEELIYAQELREKRDDKETGAA